MFTVDELRGSLASPDMHADLARAAGARALEHFGTIDILVNNAGVFHRQPLLETTVENWDETLAVNLRAPFLLSRAFGAGMRKHQAFAIGRPR